ncbi:MULTISPECIES: DUF4760 domain-containing protein [Pseudomonas]|uniref:DUF4760 domain-containing protein n=1 Tax=Pseudomonas promysalinigenes TaxID=485898 RepID=A0ABY6ANJ1_9PSED|nr:MULTISPECIES: DUF4760 domain-containing protein [Pseudomonas]PZQ38991.1 MAG: DUF4760 domain-containing protein [Pseudomonas putida]UXH41221.1 DUF4760 domain-containing protein [Pseudomonas promysalinigenes]
MWEWIGNSVASEAFRGSVMLLAVLVAVVSVISVKSTAKKKQTADLLFGTRSDDKLSAGYRCLQDLHKGADLNIRTLANGSEEHADKAASVRYVLNHWERVFVGVRQGIYDECMLREANYNVVIRMYDQARPFIEAVREKSQIPTYWQCLEQAVTRWRKKPLKKV